MKLWWRSLLVLTALLLLCAGWQQAAEQGQWAEQRLLLAQMRPASNAATQPWQTLDRERLATWRGPYELRFVLELGPGAAAEPLVLRLALRAASELVWDGQLLLRNGRVGHSAAQEQAGQVDVWAPLPAQAPGRHVLWVRASTQALPGLRNAEAEPLLLPLRQLAAARYAPWLVVAAATGCLALAWLYFGLAAWRPAAQPGLSREQALLLALGLVGLLLPLAEAWRPLLGYEYPWHQWRLRLILLLTWLAAYLLPLALATRWGLGPALRPHWRWVMGLGLLSAAGLAVLAQQVGYDAAAYTAHLVGLLLAAGCCRAGLRREAALAAPVLALLLGSLGLALAQPWAFMDGYYVLALALLMTLLLLSHAVHLLGLGEQAARSEASRLELQTRLLRSSMQPHWLMNSLTSLQELIETEPLRASQLVDLLADEFTQLRQLGEAPLITLEQELALCRAHLRIVALLRGHEVELRVQGKPSGVMLPPGLLHTQVENALTHGADMRQSPAFELFIDRHAGAVALCLLAPRGPGRAAAARPGGAGRRFIEASLAAAFGPGWQFSQGPEGAGRWASRLLLPLR